MSLSFITFLFSFLILGFFEPEFLGSFKSLIPVLLGLVMFGMGCIIETKDLKYVFKNPKWIITGIILQYTVMPITAFLLSKFFRLSDELTLGFVILGSCPGGTASNLIAYLSKANISLSVALTICSTFLATLLTPFWIFILAKEQIDINFLSLVKTTFWITIFPLIDGLIIRRIFKERIKILIRFLPKFSELCIAIIIGIIFSLAQDLINQINLTFLLTIVFHNLCGFFIGYHVSKFLNFPDKVKRTISIEVAMQNSGLGLGLAMLHFSKLAVLPSAVFSLWHNISGLIMVHIWSKKNKFA
tara:strand:- start:1416 stop:2318 length:903 start_codon:yes stop_codon:yes gene_type:complete